MKTGIFCTTLFALSTCAHAQSDDELRHEVQLAVSKAYSECAAYYDIVVSNFDDSIRVADEVAREMKDEAMLRAVAHAAEVEKKSKVRPFVEAELAKAKTAMADLADRNSEEFLESMADYRRRCRMAVNDPPEFVEKTLLAKHPRKTYLQLPEGLTVDKILKNAKPATGIKDISECSKPAVAHTMSLDDVLVDGGMVCAQHQGDVCDSERLWMSYRQYIEKRYPDRDLGGYSSKLSITFKDGKSQQVRTLIACLDIPRVST